jgi:tripartite-type tricarboxylate transporter receptor subunit TctC
VGNASFANSTAAGIPTIAALAHPSVNQRYEAVGAPVVTSTAKELAELLEAETQKWGPIVKEAGIKVD